MNQRVDEAVVRAPRSREDGAEVRFEFGENWRRFLSVLDDERIAAAERAIRAMLGVEHLRGCRFLDLGSGSGLSSLAARRLGAEVHSVDYDASSVACTRELRRRYVGGDDAGWTVERGSALDAAYLRSLGAFDVVYSWGVLHHTGAMWQALENVVDSVAPGGKLFVAIYNDQGSWSGRWARIKRFYNSGSLARSLVSATFIPAWVLRDLAADVVWRRNPVARYRSYKSGRGMSVMHDWVDWLGGYPFEYAKPEAIFDFYRDRGFELVKMKTAGGSMGCNEFVFRRPDAAGSPGGA